MRAEVPQEETIRLLWTGGWDSTFRLLQLLLPQPRPVQPYYLIDADRASTGAEIKAMKNIKSRLLQAYPSVRQFLRPIVYVDVGDLEPDREIAEAFRALVEKGHIGSQYDWTARFCKQYGIRGVELCIHRDDKAHRVLEPFVRECREDGRVTWSLDLTRAPREERSLFGYFHFPLFHVSKLEMAAAARAQDWDHLMNLTWFCHHPTRRQKPCGTCHPCLYTMEEGLAWRIPLGRRIVSRLHRMVPRPLKRVLRT